MIIPFAILAIENDDDRAFMEKLYIDHRKVMFKKAYSLLRDLNDTEDAINTTCLALIKKITLLRSFDNCTLRSYIVSSIRNTSINILDKKNRILSYQVPNPEASFATVASEEPEADYRIIQQSEIDSLKWALSQLPERDMTLLQMKYVLELPDHEIAKEIGIKTASVRAYLTKARRLAKRILEENEGFV